MSEKLEHLFEVHPMFAWLASLVSFVMGMFASAAEHADDAAKVFGVFAAIFASVAGYYTMRIQRRRWKRGDRRSNS